MSRARQKHNGRTSASNLRFIIERDAPDHSSSHFAFQYSNTNTTLHDVLHSIVSLQHNKMASGAQAHPSFPARTSFATSTKLPDRTGINNPPFGQSALNNPIQSFGQTIPRRNEPQTQFGQPQTVPQPPQHTQQGRPQQDKPRNYLADLSEEQREEINEAVCRSAATPPRT